MKPKRLLLLAGLFTLTLFGDHGLIRLFKISQIARHLRQESQSLSTENRQMVEEISRLKDPDYLERLIREERGYVRENERLLEIPKAP